MDRICPTLQRAVQQAVEAVLAKANRLTCEIAELEATLVVKRAELSALDLASDDEIERCAYVEERTGVDGNVVWVARRGRLYAADAGVT